MAVNSTDPAASASPGERSRPPVRFQVMLEGQPALVTGANSGIGRAVALGLAASGADVVVNYVVDPASAEEVVHEIEARGRKATRSRRTLATRMTSGRCSPAPSIISARCTSW